MIESDDQTQESIRFMANVNSLIGDQGATFKNSFVNFSLCCPSRATFLTGQYAHNHGILDNRAPAGGFDRFQALHGTTTSPSGSETRAITPRMIGKYLTFYANNPPVPPGWSEWQAAAPDDTRRLRLHAQRQRHAGPLRHDPADYKQDVLTGKAVDFVDRRAPKAQPFFLWLTYPAPHVGGPEPNPQPPSNCQKAPKPAPRHAHAFDSEPLPKPPNFNEANVSDKPAAIRNKPPLERDSDREHPAQVPLRAGVAALGGRGREEGLQALEGDGELTTPWSSTPRTTASSTASTGSSTARAHLRGVDPSAAPDAWAGHPRRSDHP